MNIKDFFVNKLPGVVTNTGAGLVIINALTGFLAGSIGGREALYQGAMGVIGIGLRRALSKNKSDIQEQIQATVPLK